MQVALTYDSLQNPRDGVSVGSAILQDTSVTSVFTFDKQDKIVENSGALTRWLPLKGSLTIEPEGVVNLVSQSGSFVATTSEEPDYAYIASENPLKVLQAVPGYGVVLTEINPEQGRCRLFSTLSAVVVLNNTLTRTKERLIRKFLIDKLKIIQYVADDVWVLRDGTWDDKGFWLDTFEWNDGD
jgi:hypothetical protein